MGWADRNPEAYEEIASLPPSQQNEALGRAMLDPWIEADRERKRRREEPPQKEEEDA